MSFVQTKGRILFWSKDKKYNDQRLYNKYEGHLGLAVNVHSKITNKYTKSFARNGAKWGTKHNLSHAL